MTKPKKNQTNSFVNFYDQVQQVPVSQIDAGSYIHKIRRLRLFASLGITPSAVHGSKILEIGPGSGDNAEITLSWRPKKLTLIDGSSTAISKLKQRFDRNDVEIIHGDFLKSLPNSEFDLIIAEGCIPGQKNPSLLVSTLCNRLSVNGQLLITTQTPESLLSEILRRIIAKHIVLKAAHFEEKVSLLTEFFDPSFKSLKGMTRPPSDWVVDVLIHPWENGNHVFSPKDALESIGLNIDLIGMRPQIFRNEVWYKEDVEMFSATTINFKNNIEFETYKFLDYRQTQENSKTISPDDASQISRSTKKIYFLDRTYNASENDHSLKLLSELEEIQKIVKYALPLTYDSLSDFIRNYPEFIENPLDDPFTRFHLWFGRGQQYLSFMRVK